MKLKDFKLERYFAKYEFTAKYLLSSSDCDGYELKYLLENAKEKEIILWQEMKLGYTESAGLPLLRESILQFYNIKTIENVVVASPGELNYITMNLLLKPTDHIITVSPCYQSLYEIAKSLKCEISYWTPNIENWEFNTLDLEKLIKKNTRLIVINFPHNPTGSYLNLQQLNKIVSIAIKYDLYILSDEMYRKLIIDD
ncbi:MAG: aminotransferase class I/II-fold pyridoxal phosphate-dependent enzyme, partial [Melioribacteraceae bacterium]|nr:aminotransferase class I/II-fold pyridoxal phosphate-dependent enzyme [Melioribacteraceae bacterium]